MSRRLIASLVFASAALVPGVSGRAHAEAPSGDLRASTAADELGDQGIGAEVGLATGGRVTPGGLRVAGHYLYQLSSTTGSTAPRASRSAAVPRAASAIG